MRTQSTQRGSQACELPATSSPLPPLHGSPHCSLSIVHHGGALLSQCDSACRRLRDSKNEALCQQLLPSLAAGTTFATVGLSQLTTSRQHLGPSLRISLDGDRLQLDGTIPWVTGVIEADHIVVGGVL